MNTPKNYDQKLERLRRYSRRLNRMLESGSFYELSYWKRYKQIRRIKRLYSALIGPLSANRLKVILAAASIFVLGGACPGGGEGDQIADSPSFAAAQQNPFGIVGVGSPAIPTFVDIDDDGDYDLFVNVRDGAAGDTIYFQNTGSKSAPNFAAPVTAPFGMPWAGNGVYEAVVTFADMDSNGTFDIFSGDTWKEIRYYKNTGTVSAPAFTIQATPAGLPGGGSPYSMYPTAVDLDGDGDHDLIVGLSDYGGGTIMYYKNTALSFSLVANPAGLTPSNDYPVPRFVDIDADGDLDAFIGLNTGDIDFC